MFTCKKIRNGSTYLSTHLSANDYYCEQEQVSGIWVGKGAERLGIVGQAIGKDDSAFEALRLNQRKTSSLRPVHQECPMDVPMLPSPILREHRDWGCVCDRWGSSPFHSGSLSGGSGALGTGPVVEAHLYMLHG